MTSILRQIVAGPRVKHEETGLDLCYVTSNIIATSGPSQTYPQRAYRNPLDRLVTFLDDRHGDDWAIWEFRAEGTGYPDEAVHGRIRHFPWPDHHPPPFALVPRIVGGMRRWLDGGALSAGPLVRDGGDNGGKDSGGGNDGSGDGGDGSTKGEKEKETGEGEVQEHGKGSKAEGGDVGGKGDEKGNGQGKGKGKKERVVVVHCKAGKGRSGTMACSYLIAECGWSAEDALARFTERRMRPGFGAGVSIPSQLRWVSYVDRWTRAGKRYIDRPVEIVEIRVWGLRHGVKLAVEGFVEEGRKIHIFHTFKRTERFVVEPGAPGSGGILDLVQDMAGYGASAAVDETGEVAEDANYHEITKGVESSSNGEGKSEVPSRSSSKKSRMSRATSLRSRLSIRKSGSSKNLEGLAKDNRKSKTFAVLGNSAAATSSGASSPATTGQGESLSQSTSSLQNDIAYADPSEPGGQVVAFRPSEPIRIPNSDVNIAVERRNHAPRGMGLTLVTAVAHVWFNAFFEGNGPEQDGRPDDTGVFEIDWDKMDGIKGSSRRGTRALEKLAVVWRVARGTTATGEGGGGPEKAEKEEGKEATASPPGVAINEPGDDSPVPQLQPANWKGGNDEDPDAGKRLGLRPEDPETRSVSKASSFRSAELGDAEGGGVVVTRGEQQDAGSNDDDQASLEGVKVSGPGGEDILDETPTGQGLASSSSGGNQGAR